MVCIKAPLAFLLSLSLAAPSQILWAENAPAEPRPAARIAYQSGQLQGDQRILHALNRFTFGPRPGDLEAVRAEGLDRWFDDQLHPERLDESDLEARLAQFPALQLSPADLLYNLPSDALIRQAADGKIPIPTDPTLHAIYENQIARYQLRKEEKKQAQAAGGNRAMPPMPPAETGDADQAAIVSLLALPPEQRLNELVKLQQPDFDRLRKAMKPAQRSALLAGMSPIEKEHTLALENPKNLVNNELAGQRLTRDIYSNAQLQEVMTDFWLNHFNVYLHKNEEMPYYLVSYERDVIRPLALGRFEDLLEATAHSPAMLLYLDNSSSMGPDSPTAEKQKKRDERNPGNKPKAREGLNENYARELMELHTLGVNGGYTQGDVTEVARILTGWTVEQPQRGGGFKFDPNRHEPGTKKALGKKFKENGEEEGRELLHLLATSPATAQFVCRKLAIRFVSDNPPQELIDRMAKTYLASDGDIGAVLSALYHSPEFWSTSVWRAKVKTPQEFVVSAIRAGSLDAAELQPIVNALNGMGMPLYGAVPPTGYNWQESAWVSTGALVNRMNFALALAANKLAGIPTGWSAESNGYNTPESEEQRLESLLVAGGLSAPTRAAIMQQFAEQSAGVNVPQPVEYMVFSEPAKSRPVNSDKSATSLEKQDQLLAGLLLGSPEFQRR